MLSLLCQTAECSTPTMKHLLNNAYNLKLSVPSVNPLQSNFIAPPPLSSTHSVRDMQRRLVDGGETHSSTWCVWAGNLIVGRYKNSSKGLWRPLPWPAVNCHWTSVPAEDKTVLYVCASTYFWDSGFLNSLFKRSWHFDNRLFSFTGVTRCILTPISPVIKQP